MSGHSHWATIKHKKGAEDARRSKIFSKMAKLISIAAREKGGDPEANPNLRMTIEKAKSLNMPKDNIERAIKKGTGELKGEVLETISFEAYGPGGIALIVEGITDNKNRAITEIRQVLNRNNGKLVAEGAVSWMFEKKGIIILDKKNLTKSGEELEMIIIESGADNFKEYEETIEIYTKIENLENVKKYLEQASIEMDSASLGWVAKELVKINEKDLGSTQKLFEALNDNDDVSEVYSNLKE